MASKVVSTILNLKDNMSDGLLKVSKNTEGVTREMQQATRQVIAFKNKGVAAVRNFASDSGRKLASVAKKFTALGTAAITAGAGACVKATFDTQTAIGELASLGVQDLDAIEQAAKRFSDTWAGTTKADFISAAYDIKSGIASLSDKGVAQFTDLAGLTAKATKSTTGEMTSLFATSYGIYKDFYSEMSDMDFGTMFSGALAKSVQQFKTDGSNMAGAIQSLGASATNAGVAMEEQFAVLGMLQATMSGSEAGTKYNAFLGAAASAGDKLGLSFVDTNNKLLGMGDILTKLRKKYGDTIDAAEKTKLKEAFGSEEAVKLIDLLYNKTGALGDSITALSGAMAGGTGVTTDMANAMNQKLPARLEIMKQKFQNFQEAIGSGLLPIVDKAIDKFDEWNKNGALDVLAEKISGGLTTAISYGGEVLEWLNPKIDTVKQKFEQWKNNGGLDTLTGQLKDGLAVALNMSGDAMDFVVEHTDAVIGILKLLAVCWGTGQVFSFVTNIASGIHTLGLFKATLVKVIPQLWAQIGALGTSSAAWIHNTAMAAVNKAGMIASSIASGIATGATTALTTAQWLLNAGISKVTYAFGLFKSTLVRVIPQIWAQVVALGANAAAWIHNTAVAAVNKAGMIASSIASGIATGATTALTTAQWLLNAAFVASPIGWVILGIVALIAAGVLLYKNWDKVKETALTLWDNIKTVFGGIKESIIGAFQAVKDKVKGVFDWIGEKLAWIGEKITSIPVVGDAISAIGNAVVGHNAVGTSYWKGGLTHVNERGGEIINLPSGTQIIPHDISSKALGNGGNNINIQITIQGNVVGNQQFMNKLANETARQVLRAIENV